MIDELTKKDVQWMILEENRAGDQDFQARNYIGSKLLDRYIIQHYTAVRAFDGFSAYKKGNDRK
jgi:hypothetical protein